MKAFMIFFSTLILISTLFLSGCASSEQTEQPPPAVQKQPEEQPVQKIDTVSVNVQNVPPPQAEPKPVPPPVTPPPISKWTGKFAVQIGAFKMADKAEQIAAAAKERLNMKVFTVYDKEKDLTKVLVGDFMTKDEARKYRDQLTRQYPDDYKDAWVTEFPHE